MAVMEKSKIKYEVYKISDNTVTALNKQMACKSPSGYKAFFDDAFYSLLLRNNKQIIKPDYSSARYAVLRIKKFLKLCILGGVAKRLKWLTNPMVLFYPWKHMATFGKLLRFKKGRILLLGRTHVFSNTKLKLFKIFSSHDFDDVDVVSSAHSKKISTINNFKLKRIAVNNRRTTRLISLKRVLVKDVTNDVAINASNFLPKFNGLKANNANFYASALYFKNKTDTRDLTKLYKNTLYASLYNEYRDYAVTSVIKKVSCFFKFQNSISTNMLNKELDSNFYSKKKNMKQFMYAKSSIYLKTYGPVAKIARRKRYLTIRFVPGYLPFFRKIRARFVRTRRLNFGRQRMLTRYIVRYRRMSNSAMLKYYSLTLRQVSVSLRFAYNIVHAVDIIRLGNILVNGVIATSEFFQLFKYDTVSLNVNYFNYAYVASNFIKSVDEIFKFYTNITRLDDLKRRKLSYKKNSSNRYLYRKVEKIRLSRVERVYSSINDVPDYFELDYLTLSAVILFEPCRMQDHDQVFVRCSAFSFIKMLNWKYMC